MIVLPWLAGSLKVGEFLESAHEISQGGQLLALDLKMKIRLFTRLTQTLLGFSPCAI
jgi:hypothetical protein